MEDLFNCRYIYNYWKNLKTLWQKEKLLVLSNFFFCHDVFESSGAGCVKIRLLWERVTWVIRESPVLLHIIYPPIVLSYSPESMTKLSLSYNCHLILTFIFVVCQSKIEITVEPVFKDHQWEHNNMVFVHRTGGLQFHGQLCRKCITGKTKNYRLLKSGNHYSYVVF